MADTEMPIFTRTFDLLSWLLPATVDYWQRFDNGGDMSLLLVEGANS